MTIYVDKTMTLTVTPALLLRRIYAYSFVDGRTLSGANNLHTIQYNDILYKPGKENFIADALSRNPIENAEIHHVLMRAQKVK